MKTTRTYVMRARADATEHTRERILQATTELGWSRPIASITLPLVAQHAGVSVQTILRQFGSRDALLDSTLQYAAEQTAAERKTPPGDMLRAVTVLFDHYERRGDGAMLLLGQESWDTSVRAITDAGRAEHRQWVTDAFAPLFADRPKREHPEMIDMLVVATDVYTWKLLRRDRELTRPLPSVA